MKRLYILVLAVLLCTLAKGQARVDITTCDGTTTGIVCVAPGDSLYNLCVKVTPGPCADKNYTIDWGDGQVEPVSLTSDKTLNHKYDLRNFIRNCSNGEFKVSIFVENKTCPNDNKGFRVTFNKKPEARPFVQSACEGSSVSISNNSCPTSPDIQFLWEFSDGQTSTSTYPYVSFTDPNKLYKIKLTATSLNCGVSTAETEFKIKKKPVPEFKTTGTSVIGADTVVCLSKGGVLSIDGTVSTDETGYYWQISGGRYQYTDNTDVYSGVIKIQLGEVAEYTISLIARNDCGDSKMLTRKLKVVNLPTLALTPQPDVCEEITYKISNPVPGAMYLLNGKTLDASQQVTLALSNTPYIVTGSLSNACGTQVVADTFSVSAPQQVKILSFPNDTTICISNNPVTLLASVAGGAWSGQGIETQNQHSVFVPKATGDYTITYSRGIGKCLTTDAVRVIVDGIQVSVTDQTVCKGVPSVKLSGAPAGGKWMTTNCVNCISGDTLFLGSVSVDHVNVTYEAGNQNGCKASAVAKISIGQPKADFQLASACLGAVFRPVNNSTGASNYVWLIDGIKVSVETDPTLSLAVGTHSITLEAGSGSCSDKMVKQITVTAPPPVLTFTPSETLGCAPLKVGFKLNGTADPTTEYSWTFGNGGTFTGAQPDVQVFDNFSKLDRNYTVVLTSRNACGEQTDTRNVVVRPFVQAEIGIDSTTLRCTPAQILFSNRSSGHDKPLSRWIFGDGTILQSGADTLSHTFSAKDSAQTYRIKLEISSSCGLDTAEAQIRVYPTNVKALYTISKSIVCPGEVVQFTDATVPKPNRWLWKFGDGSTSTQASPTHAFKQPQTEFKVTLIAFMACGYDSTQLTIKTTEALSGDFDDVPIACEGSSVQFRNRSSTQLGFVWDFGDGSTDSSDYSPEHLYVKAGNYVASLYAYRGTQTCKVLVKKSSVSVVSSPVADFGFQTDSLFCAPGPVSIINHSTNADSYQWSFSDGRISDVKNPSLPFQPGLYAVKLVAGKGGVCKDSVERMAAFVVQECKVDIPDAFTPNGDGIGDRYTIFGNGVRMINSLKIRNRWGELVFEAKNIPGGSQQPNESWDGNFGGKPAPSDMYVYEAEILYADKRVSEKLRGNLYLVR